MKKSKINILLVMLLFSYCDYFNTEFENDEEAKLYQATSIVTPPTAPTSVNLMNWNVKFGAGRIDIFFDCYGARSRMTKNEINANLDGMIVKIVAANPDILIVQEIDANATRSAYVDMVQYILDRSQFNYAAYASQWKVDYVPSGGVGRINSGNAIFSRWPITETTRIQLALRSDQDTVTKYFYLRRNLLKATIDLGGGKTIVGMGVHTAAFSNDGTKQKQIIQIKEQIDASVAAGAVTFLAGDFNTIPPGSAKTSGFPDSICTDEAFQADDYSNEGTLMQPLYDTYFEAIDLATYQASNTPYFTHTTNKNGFWNRKLDYIFSNNVLTTGLVHQNTALGGTETMPLSDHAPVTATLATP